MAYANLQHPQITIKYLLETHYKEYGRNYFTRYDYEDVESEGANRMMARLQQLVGVDKANVIGSEWNGYKVAACDDFCYTDPIDGSVSAKQVRIMHYIVLLMAGRSNHV